MKELIRNILKEQSSKLDLLNVIQNEDIFAAADLVGGMDNLRKIFKDNSDVVEKLDLFNGKLDLIYHSRKEFIEISMKFEIVGKGENVFKNNSWPIVNLIYDDSNLSESEKKLFEQFIYDTISDLNIDNVVIAPAARQMFREKGGYIGIKYVNGRDLEELDHDIRYEDSDIRNIHREYYTKSYMNESKIVDKIKSFFGKKPLTKEEMKDEKLLNLMVQFINDNYSIDFDSDADGEVTFYLTDSVGNFIVPPIMTYYPKYKSLHYSWDFAQDIHNWIGDDRLIQPVNSKLMGKVFEKLFKKKVNYVYGYSRL